ncbi:MAG: hypothetical protein K6G03_07395 [Lachnospiraceae bacterium]|nr:hypothetical protein [Lachnospiraceae bacterium]
MILLQILKIIGIVLLVIILLILFLIAVILFVPIHYNFSGSYNEEEGAEAAANANWILHIFRFVYNLSGDKSDYSLKALCFEIYPGKTYQNEGDPGKEDEDENSIFTKIKYKITSLYVRIRQVIKKIRQILFILNDERDQDAVRELFFRVGILLKHVLPRKGLLRLHIGFLYPSRTGYITGLIYSLYPIYTNHLLLQPDFDGQALDADLNMKGHVQLIFVLIAAVRIYFNKDIRRLYNHIQQVAS